MSPVALMMRPCLRRTDPIERSGLSVLLVLILIAPVPMGLLLENDAGASPPSELTFQSSQLSFSGPRATYYPNHPRLLFRDTETSKVWGRCQGAIAWQSRCNQLLGAGYGIDREIPSFAMRYILNGNTADADHAITLMLAAGTTVANATLLADLSLGFDWLYNYTGFDATEKTNVINKMVALQTTVEGTLWMRHIFGKDMAETGAIGLAGLALYGHHANAQAYINSAVENSTFIMAGLDYTNGTWPEGLWYLNKERLPLFLEFLEAYRTATEPSIDYFADIKNNQHDWLTKMLYFHIYNWMPYGEFARFGDMPSSTAQKFYRQNLDLIVAKTQDPAGMDFINTLEATASAIPTYSTGLIFKFILFYDTGWPTGGMSALPKVMWFGPKTLDYIVMRTGWGANDEVITFRSGDGFANHQHLDAGAFTITRGQPLAIDSGTNATFGTEHRENYYIRSVAHNTMQVRQDGEPFQCPAFGGWCSNDWGQRIYSYNPSYQSQEDDNKLSSYLTSKSAGTHFETGNIVGLDIGADYVYVQGNYTQAYNNLQYKVSPQAKVSMVTRQMVLLGPDWLVIKDRLFATQGVYRTRFPLHVLGTPTINGTLRGYDEGGAPFYDGETTSLEWNGAYLHTRTLYPEIHRTIDRTGSGKEYWSDSANRLAGATSDPMAGSGRIDIQDEVSQMNHEFLNVMNIQGSGGSSTMPEVVRIKEPTVMGAYFNSTIVLFSRNDKNYQLASINTTQNGTTQVLAFDIIPSKHYQIMNIDKNGGKVQLLEADSSANGTLAFKVDLTGKNQIVIGWSTEGDITIDSMTSTPTKPNEGDNVTIKAAIKNKSTYSFTICNWFADFYLGDPDGTGKLLGTVPVDVLPLSTKTFNFTTKIPWNPKSQQVFARLKANISCPFVDSDATNNDLYTWVYINSKPVAKIIAPASAFVNQEVQFDGTQSYDLEGMIQTRKWNWGDGSPEENGALPKHKFWYEGNFTVTLTLVDMNGASNNSTHKIMIKRILRAPQPYFTMYTDPPVTVGNVTTTYIFNSTSVDLDNLIEQYIWDFGDGTNATGPNVTHRYAQDGYFNISMTIRWNTTQTAMAWWWWLHVANLPPVANATVNGALELRTFKREPVIFNASGTIDLDTPFQLHTYRWYFDQKNSLDYKDGAVVEHRFTVTGTFNVRLMVIDDSGASDNATVTVIVGNRPPKANISCSNFTLEWNQLLWVDAWRSTDPDGDSLRYSWAFGDNTTPAKTMIGKHYYGKEGNYTVTLTVMDDDGATDSTSIRITQKPQIEEPPPPPVEDGWGKTRMYYILGAGVGIGAIVAAAAVIMLRRKKAQKEALDAKQKEQQEQAAQGKDAQDAPSGPTLEAQSQQYSQTEQYNGQQDGYDQAQYQQSASGQSTDQPYQDAQTGSDTVPERLDEEEE